VDNAITRTATFISEESIFGQGKNALDGDFVLNLKDLEGRTLTDKTLNFQNGTVNGISLPKDEFPIKGSGKVFIGPLSIPIDVYSAIQDVTLAVSNDPTRCHMWGVYVEFCSPTEDAPTSSVKFTSTDGHILFHYEVPGTFPDGLHDSYIVSPGLFPKVDAKGAGRDVKFYFSEDGQTAQVKFNTSLLVEVSFVDGNIDATFPNYKRILADEHPHSFSFDKEELLRLIKDIGPHVYVDYSRVKVVAIMKNKGEEAYLTSIKDNAHLRLPFPSFSHSKEDEDFSMGVNLEHLRRCVAKGDKAVFNYKQTEGSYPCKICRLDEIVSCKGLQVKAIKCLVSRTVE
jgi:DNA polymerase III sliding clamp (beta) subunit (PCNA family)